MFSELDSRAKKLEKEQQKRLEVQKKQQAEKQKLDEEYKRQQLELEERARQKKELEEQLEEEQRLKNEAENTLTGGVKFLCSLIPYEIDSEDDKVILPEDSLNELNAQNAIGNGVLLFRITNDLNGKVSHCGCREFTAPPHHIGLPRKVIDSLQDEVASTSLNTVTIKYVRLSKCTYVKLRPRLNQFSKVTEVKRCLEENLVHHATCTVGDVLTVWYRGVAHALVVVEMRPEYAGTLIETDVEVDLEQSEEFLQHVQSLPPLPLPRIPYSARVLNESKLDASIEDSSHSHAVDLKALKSQLDDEPPASTPSSDIIQLKIRTPSGSSLVRRFLRSAPLLQLFLFIAVELKVDVEKIQVSTRMPKRSFDYAAASRLQNEDKTEVRTFLNSDLNVPSEAMILTITA